MVGFHATADSSAARCTCDRASSRTPAGSRVKSCCRARRSCRLSQSISLSAHHHLASRTPNSRRTRKADQPMCLLVLAWRAHPRYRPGSRREPGRVPRAHRRAARRSGPPRTTSSRAAMCAPAALARPGSRAAASVSSRTSASCSGRAGPRPRAARLIPDYPVGRGRPRGAISPASKQMRPATPASTSSSATSTSSGTPRTAWTVSAQPLPPGVHGLSATSSSTRRGRNSNGSRRKASKAWLERAGECERQSPRPATPTPSSRSCSTCWPTARRRLEGLRLHGTFARMGTRHRRHLSSLTQLMEHGAPPILLIEPRARP